MAVNIHITIIELNALHTKRQNLFQELDAVIHLLMEAKHWGLRKSRNATSLNSRDRKSGSAGMPRPNSYAVFCLKKKKLFPLGPRFSIDFPHETLPLVFFLSPPLSQIYTLSLHDALPISLHTKRQNLFQELDAVIHLLMEAKHWGLRKSRNATSLNSRFKSLDTLKVKIISVTFRRVIRTNHKKASKIWRHENIQLGGCQS